MHVSTKAKYVLVYRFATTSAKVVDDPLLQVPKERKENVGHEMTTTVLHQYCIRVHSNRNTNVIIIIISIA